MANRTLLAFRRRHNEDGTWDSICLRCFRTAATARDAGNVSVRTLVGGQSQPEHLTCGLEGRGFAITRLIDPSHEIDACGAVAARDRPRTERMRSTSRGRARTRRRAHRIAPPPSAIDRVCLKCATTSPAISSHLQRCETNRPTEPPSWVCCSPTASKGTSKDGSCWRSRSYDAKQSNEPATGSRPSPSG